jgi:hypothetical protein
MNITKSLLGFILLFSITSEANAVKRVIFPSTPMMTEFFLDSTTYEPPQQFTGIYVGGQVSLIKGNFIHESLVTINDSFTGSSLFLENPQINNKLIPSGNIHLGMGKTLNKIYFGGEVFANYAFALHQGEIYSQTTYTCYPCIHDPDPTPNEPTIITLSLTNKINVESPNIEYGIDFRPGYLIYPDLLLYGRLGLSHAKFTVDTLTYYTSPFILFGVTSELIYHTSRWGRRLGVGLEKKLNSRLSGYVDYVYVSYPNIQRSQQIPTIYGSHFTSNYTSTKISPANQIFSLGLNIKLF